MLHKSTNTDSTETPYPPLSRNEFVFKLRLLVALSWTIPPIIGLGFIIYIGVLSVDQLLNILVTPIEPGYILGWLFFSIWYLNRYTRPVQSYLDDPDNQSDTLALKCIQGFIFRFWSLFLIYLLFAPGSVILSAELYANYSATTFDWFLIHLIALIVSIVVGLPIFFLLLDLFGKSIGHMRLIKPHITIKTKVFLIGALIPLLIDSMLVLYYWSRTRFFESETFIVWLSLELLAIAASVVFSRSFAQSLSPLQSSSTLTVGTPAYPITQILPRSNDELGVLSRNYGILLYDLRAYGEVMELSNNLLRELGKARSVAQSVNTIINVCEQIMEVDTVFLVLYDEDRQRLMGAAYTGHEYKQEGYFELGLNEVSMAVLTFNANETINIRDANSDPRCKPDMLNRFAVKSALSTPLRIENKTMGVLMAVSIDKIVNFSHRDEMIIEALAKEAAIALHTNKLLGDKERAIDERRERDELIKLLMASTEEGIYGIDLEGNCSFVNSSALKMLGYQDESQLLGNKIHRRILRPSTDENGKEQENDIEASMRAGITSHSDNISLYRADNSSFPIEYWSHPVIKDGKTIAAVVTFVDITERKKIADELDQHRHQLTDLVKQRTVEAERVNKELESFSYSVSHDLRAPLRAMAGFSEILLEDHAEQLDSVAKDYLNRIKTNSQKMGFLIDDLLNLTRINRGNLKNEQVNLSDIASELLHYYQQNEPDRKVNIQIQSDLKVFGDYGMLRIMLDNLLGNAWKYSSKQAQAQITFTKHQLESGEEEFLVCDNGVGFDTKYTDNIFKDFQRLHSDNDFPGTGIGLATVKRVLDRHGGFIRATSEIGRGSCFYFVIPNPPEP